MRRGGGGVEERDRGGDELHSWLLRELGLKKMLLKRLDACIVSNWFILGQAAGKAFNQGPKGHMLSHRRNGGSKSSILTWNHGQRS